MLPLRSGAFLFRIRGQRGPRRPRHHEVFYRFAFSSLEFFVVHVDQLDVASFRSSARIALAVLKSPRPVELEKAQSASPLLSLGR